MDISQPENLKNAGLKTTLPRLKILGLFESGQERHMSAEDVYKQLSASGDDVGLATVYRVLTQFEHAGLLVRHNFEGGKSVFELNQGKHHDHIVCLQCGHVEEFYDDAIEARQKKVASNLGFEIHDHSLSIYADCAKVKCPHKR
jgi:Fur family ferric uptake transcriptional regulator